MMGWGFTPHAETPFLWQAQVLYIYLHSRYVCIFLCTLPLALARKEPMGLSGVQQSNHGYDHGQCGLIPHKR